MSIVKTKKVSTIGKADRANLEHYFNQLTGVEAPDFEIVQPKFTVLERSAGTIHTTLTHFATALHGLGYEEQAIQITAFADRAKDYRAEIKENEPTAELWAKVKNHDFLQTCLIMCSKLAEVHAHLTYSWETVDRKFMNRYTGLTFAPFIPWCDLDAKHLYLVDGAENAQVQELTFTVLKNLFNATREMYDAYMNPDVDISKISTLIIQALGGLAKQPELSRCKQAFRKIEESANMLKDNFGEYYRDFLQTKDPNNIFTAFISDVANNCGSDVQLIRQCREIVKYYQKNAQKKTASGEFNGESRQMFETLLNNYKILDATASEKTGMKPMGEDEEEETKEEEPTAQETPEEDARDLDELLAQINDPRAKSVTPASKKA